MDEFAIKGYYLINSFDNSDKYFAWILSNKGNNKIQN